MRRLTLCACIAMIMSLLVSCDHGSDPTPETEKAQKTILVYMPWTASGTSSSGSLYSAFLDNINSIESGIIQQGGLKNNKVLVFIAKNATYAALIQINYANNQCQRDTLKRYNRYNYTTPSGIAGILNDVQSFAPAQYYDMLIGCHGSGWIPKTIDDFYSTRAFGGTTTAYKTDLTDLADGINIAGMHMQFISFDDCYMANVEVAYDLRDVADYLVASTSEIMEEGMPYEQMWPYIASVEPDYQNMCNAFYDYYANSSTPYGTLSAIDLSKIDQTAELMLSINSSFTLEDSLISSIQKLDGLGETIFFDFGDYIDKLVTDENIRLSMRAMISSLVPYHVHTSQIFTAYSDYNGGFETVDINTFSGITISDPTQNQHVVNSKTSTAWWIATH